MYNKTDIYIVPYLHFNHLAQEPEEIILLMLDDGQCQDIQSQLNKLELPPPETQAE